jgi:hypothetical protein
MTIDDLKISTITSRQNSTINSLSQEKFSNYLNTESNDEESNADETPTKLNTFMYSLQNQAQLNRMVIESFA